MGKNSAKVLELRLQEGGLLGEIFDFTYNAKRMAGAPTISCSFYSFDENAVESGYYVEFNGEKYYLRQTPSSSKSNSDARYKYDLEFISERHTLENIYFYDVSFVDENISAKKTTFKFSGTIHELAEKLQLSIDFSYGVKDYYKIIIDSGIDDLHEDWKVLEFQDKDILSSIQEFYNTFNQPYYYVSKDNGDGTFSREIHVGYESESVIEDVLKYGANESLLSVSRTNANFKVINKITGYGSTENIPYYYPNLSSTGEHTFEADEGFGNVDINYDILNKHVNIVDGCELTFNSTMDLPRPDYKLRYYNADNTRVEAKKVSSFVDTVYLEKAWKAESDEYGFTNYENRVTVRLGYVGEGFEFKLRTQYAFSVLGADVDREIRRYYLSRVGGLNVTVVRDGDEIKVTTKNVVEIATTEIYFDFIVEANSTSESLNANMSFSLRRLDIAQGEFFTVNDGDKTIPLDESGVHIGIPINGGKIKVSPTLNWIEPQKELMPTIYRETYGRERFYLAKNEDVVVSGTTKDKYNDEPYTYSYTYNYGEYNASGELIERNTFNHPYIQGRQVEHVLNVEDIKPTIKGTEYTVNGITYPIDIFDEFAYDENDNDEIDEDSEYKHPYFYGKLNPLGFNLFTHASEQGEMTISMTSGACGACNFIIGVDEETGKNTVQVDSEGNLLRDEEGNVRSGRKGMNKETPLPSQNDTTSRHVWIALKKDEETFGVIYPNALSNIKPISKQDERNDVSGLSKADTFVITNINLPDIYVFAAEKRLENAIKDYLINNNDEKFKFSVKFSRIFLAQNTKINNQINENSRISLEYFGNVYDGLYVSSYTYKVNKNEALPEITIELTDTLGTNKGVLQSVANRVKMEVMASVSSVDVVAQAARAFLRKDQNDQTAYKITTKELDVQGGGVIHGTLSIGNDMSVEGESHVKGRATFDDNIVSNGDVTVGDYEDVFGEIQGAKVLQDGSGVFKSIRANRLDIFTLMYNQVRSSSAYTSFDDTATIVSVEQVDVRSSNKHFKLTFEEDKSSKSHPFENGDILFGFANAINNYGYSKSGRCWLMVDADVITDEPWSLIAIMFAEEDCPNGENIEPTANMSLMHMGNVIVEKTERQNTFYISAKDGYIVQLLGVTSPKLFTLMDKENNPDNYSNYGVVIGKLPDDLFNYIHDVHNFIRPEDPVLYAKYAAIQNLLMIDYAGRPIKTENYRGLWVAGEEYINTPTTYTTVTHNGSKWQCAVESTTEEPKIGIVDWVVMVAKGDDGKDALPPSMNILNNTAFTNVDEEGNLEGWTTSTTAGVVEVMDKSQSGIGANALLISKARESAERNILRQTDIDLAANSWYTISFFARSMQDVDAVLVLYFNFTETTIYINGEREMFSAGGEPITVTPEWKQYYLTFQTTERETGRTLNFNHQAGNIGDAYAISKIKLEYASNQEDPQNALPSAWMESSEDLRGPQGNGVAIVDKSILYVTSESGTETPTSGWQEAIPSTVNGRYLWSKTTVVYSDGNSTETYSVSRMGVDGKGIQSSIVEYYQSENTIDPEGNGIIWSTFPSNLEDGWWLYTRTTVIYSDGEQTTSYDVTQIGQGSYYAGLQEYYALSDGDAEEKIPSGYPIKTDSNGNALANNGYIDGIATFVKGETVSIGEQWSTSRPAYETGMGYLWNFSISRDSKGNQYVSYPICIGNFAKGIVEVKELYATSQYSEPDGEGKYPTDITGWEDEQINSAPTKEKPYQWNQTATTYNDGTTEYVYHVSAVRGDDGEAGAEAGPTYTIVPSVDAIYVRNDGTMTADSIVITIGETTPHGYHEIVNSSESDSKALYLSVSTDGKTYSQATVGVPLHITTALEVLYVRLVGRRGTPIYNTRTIPVVREGKSGKDAITLHAEPASINVLVDAQNDTLIDIYNTKKDVVVYARDPFGRLSTDDYSISPLPQVDKFTFSAVTKHDNSYSFSVKISDDATRDDMPEFFDVEFVHSDGTSLGSLPISIAISERGFVGPAGDNGAMLLPYGYWSAETAYKLLRDSNGKVVGRPLVYYVEKGATKGTYFVLQKDIPENGGVDTSNTEYWTPFQEYKAIYTEALMADYAKFGDDNGAIFFKQFLFSQRGQGNKDYSHFLPDNSEGNEPIFTTDKDGNYVLSDSFNPKLHLDFLNGLANLSCLCEPYVVPEAEDGVVQIDMKSGFNVKIPYNDENLIRPVLVLPKLKNTPSWYKNGAHVEIMYESGGSAFASYVNGNILSNPATAKGKFILVCVDNPCDNDDGIVDSTREWGGQSYIMCRGKRAKYLILGVGGYVRFRAVEVGDTTMWYVTTEGNVSEEKVDIYSRYDRGGLYDDADGEVTYGQYNRVQFYGSDYSVEINMQVQQEGVACRSLMLYSGPEGLCPRNIKFTSGNNSGNPHYEVVPSSDINYYYETEDGEEYIGGYGPILGD